MRRFQLIKWAIALGLWALCAVIVLLSWTCAAAAEATGFKVASVAFGAAVFADAWTSERGFDAGYNEANRTLPAHPTDSRFFAQVIVCDTAVYLYAWHLRKRHPVAATWVLIGGAFVHGLAAASNDRIWDGDR